jgi:glycosyltransferase involved in cell wall biosynthesis
MLAERYGKTIHHIFAVTMNICIFLHDIHSGGGTERMATALANELMQRKHNVHVVSLAPAGKPFFRVMQGIALHSLNISISQLTTRYFAAIKKLRTFLKREAIDVIIDVDVILSAISIPASWRTTTKVIAWEHYNYFVKRESKVRVWGRKLAARKAAAVVTLTEEDAGNYKKNCTCKAKIVAIPNFIHTLPEKMASPDNRVMLAVGHLIHCKGFDLLINAWALLKNEGLDGWKLHIVGDGEEKENLIAQVTVLQLQQDIIFFPPTTNIAEHYLAASVYVMSSRAEGFGMVLIEAFSFGLPAVSFNCKLGPGEIIHNGVDGFLVSPEDVPALKDKLQLLLQHEDLRNTMAVNARESAKRFLSSEIITQWEDLLNTL